MSRDPRQIFARIIRWRRFLDDPWGPIRLHSKRLRHGMLCECPFCRTSCENIGVIVTTTGPTIRQRDLEYRCYGCGGHFEVRDTPA